MANRSTGDADAGKVVGKRGFTIRSIRTILMGVAAKERKRVRVEVLE